MARFYDVTGGAVLVDGVDVRTYDLTEYRQRLGVVPQEAYLFSGTVAEAIAYARPSASDEDVEAAARAVGAHEMIMHLPDGYDARGRRARTEPVGRAAAAHRAGPGRAGRPRHPAARRGDGGA